MLLCYSSARPGRGGRWRVDPLHGDGESFWSPDWAWSVIMTPLEHTWRWIMNIINVSHLVFILIWLISCGVMTDEEITEGRFPDYCRNILTWKNILCDEVNIKLPSQAANAGVKYPLSGICNFFTLCISCVLWHSFWHCLSNIFFHASHFIQTYLLKWVIIRSMSMSVKCQHNVTV